MGQVFPGESFRASSQSIPNEFRFLRRIHEIHVIPGKGVLSAPVGDLVKVTLRDLTTELRFRQTASRHFSAQRLESVEHKRVSGHRGHADAADAVDHRHVGRRRGEAEGVGGCDAAGAAARRYDVILDAGAVEAENRRHESAEHVESGFRVNVFSREVAAAGRLKKGGFGERMGERKMEIIVRQDREKQ